MPFHMSGTNATASFHEYNDVNGTQTNFNGTAEETLRALSNAAIGIRLGTGGGRRQSSNTSYHTNANANRERSGGGNRLTDTSVSDTREGRARITEISDEEAGMAGISENIRRNSPNGVTNTEAGSYITNGVSYAAGGYTTNNGNSSSIEREESITRGISGTSAGNGLTIKDISNTITEVENKPTISNEEAAEDSKLTHRGASDTGSGKGKGKANEAVPDDDKKTKKDEEADMTAMLMTDPTFKLIIQLIWVWIRSFFPCLRK